MKRKTKVILIIFIIFIVLPFGARALKNATTPAVGMLEITGSIEDSLPYLEVIRQFQDDDRVRAVVVRLDSPGGKVAPSQEIYEALLKLKGKKPVVASLASVGASGAYYIACAAHSIYALSGTLTGSIGVTIEFFNVSRGMQKLGVRHDSITTGDLKGAGSPFKDLSEKEREYFTALSRDIHEQFKDAVVKSRKMPADKVNECADGRVFTGRQALSLGLIDKLGGFDKAVEDAGKRGGIEGRPRIIKGEYKKGLVDELRQLIRAYAPASLSKDPFSTGFLRFEYSIR